MPMAKTRTACMVLVLAMVATAGTAAETPAAADPLLSGPMPAYADLRETAIWIQTRHAADAQLRFHPEGRPADARLTKAIRTDERDDFIAVFTLSELEPGTRYAYELYLDGRPVARPYPFTFATQALWRWRTDPPDHVRTYLNTLFLQDHDRWEALERAAAGAEAAQ